MKLDPDEEDVHRTLRPLREGWRHVRTDAASRSVLRIQSLDGDDGPATDEVVASTTRSFVNIVVNLIRNFFRKD